MARYQHIKQFFNGAIWSMLSTIARACSALVVNKLFAAYYGPTGITLLSHFQSLITLITTLPNSGVNVGLTRYLAQGDIQDKQYASVFWTGFWLNLLSLGVLLVLFLLFPSFFLIRFGLDVLLQESRWYVVIGILLIVLLLLHLFWLSVLLARQALRAYVLISLITSVCTIGTVWWAVEHLTIKAVLLSFLVGQAFSGLIGGIICFSNQYIPKWQVKLSRESVRELGKFVLMAVSTLLGGKLADFIVREIAISRFTLHDTGMWQSVVKISDNYTLVYSSILGMVYYPKIASLLNKEQDLKKYIKVIFSALIPLVGAVLLMVSWLREYLIVYLFNKEFLPAESLFDYQLIADFFRMVAWVLSYVIAVRAQVKLYAFIQFVFPLIYVSLVLGFIPVYGIEGVIMAGAFTSGLFLLFHLYLFRSYFLNS